MSRNVMDFAQDFDPEDDIDTSTSALATIRGSSAVEDGDDDFEAQEYRRYRQGISLTDGAYKGKRVSKKDILDEDEEYDGSGDEGIDIAMGMDMDSDDDAAFAGMDSHWEEESLDEDMGDVDDVETKGNSASMEELRKLDEELHEIEEEEHEAVKDLQQDTVQEVEKARASKNQQALWDSFLGFRIRLQSGMSLASKLPIPPSKSVDSVPLEDFVEFGDTQMKSEAIGVREDLQDLIGSFVSLRKSLARQRSDVPNLNATDDADADGIDELPPSKKRKKTKTEELWEDIQEMDDKFLPYRNSILDKWYRRTHVLSPEAAKKFTALSASFAQQLAMTLQDKDRLIKRSQIRRAATTSASGGSKIIGVSTVKFNGKGKGTDSDSDSEGEGEGGDEAKDKHKYNEEFDPNIYDDSEFYHQLLKELVDRGGGGDTGASSEARQWLDQKRKHPKRHRNVDRSASKGRKVRYTIMDKLVNFMAPNTSEMAQGDPEVSRNLISSLFGK